MQTTLRLIAAILVATVGIYGGVILARYAEADDAPGGVVIAFGLMLGAVTVAAARASARVPAIPTYFIAAPFFLEKVTNLSTTRIRVGRTRASSARHKLRLLFRAKARTRLAISCQSRRLGGNGLGGAGGML